jgi:hypothetical protein
MNRNLKSVGIPIPSLCPARARIWLARFSLACQAPGEKKCHAVAVMEPFAAAKLRR